VFKRIEGKHSVQQDLAAVNPNFKTDIEEYAFNCGNCTAAYEMRRRGFDVEAMPRKFMIVEEWMDLFDGFMPEMPLSGTNAEAVAEIEQKILLWGEGARGTVYGEYEAWGMYNGGAHFFSIEVSGGKVMFVDGQNGMDDAKWYLYQMIPSSIIFGRLDDLKPTDAVKNTVRDRRD